MRRRKFIEISAYSIAAISVPLFKGCKSHIANKAIAQPPFLSHMFDVKTLKETGKTYLKQMPAEGNIDKLEEQLLENNTISKESDTASVHSFFDKMIREDFETGKTVILNGWVLSVTEARQCALFSLIQN